jgi:hypothetical protein
MEAGVKISQSCKASVLIFVKVAKRRVWRIRISKNRQHNGQNKKYKRTNNDLENIHVCSTF